VCSTSGVIIQLGNAADVLASLLTLVGVIVALVIVSRVVGRREEEGLNYGTY